MLVLFFIKYNSRDMVSVFICASFASAFVMSADAVRQNIVLALANVVIVTALCLNAKLFARQSSIC